MRGEMPKTVSVPSASAEGSGNITAEFWLTELTVLDGRSGPSGKNPAISIVSISPKAPRHQIPESRATPELPPPDSKRWGIRRKAAVAAAVWGGKITSGE